MHVVGAPNNSPGHDSAELRKRYTVHAFYGLRKKKPMAYADVASTGYTLSEFGYRYTLLGQVYSVQNVT